MWTTSVTFALLLQILTYQTAEAQVGLTREQFCRCDLMAADIPSCPRNQLNARAYCECLNSRERSCYDRTPILRANNCPQPLVWDCENLRDGTPFSRLPTKSTSVVPLSTFKAPYTAEGGLLCVELGYCFRPTRTKTVSTITMSSGGTTGTAIITVPIGLDGLTLPTSGAASLTQEPVIVFTPDRRVKRTAAPTKTTSSWNG